MTVRAGARHIVFLVHYFPPINSAGGKRIEALAKYFAQAGRSVSVVTTIKRAPAAAFSEQLPPGVEVLLIDSIGRLGDNKVVAGDASSLSTSGSGGRGLVRKVKDAVMRVFGQLPDARLPFSLAMASPFLAKEVCQTLRSADVVIGSSPPWPMLLAALIVRQRFGPRAVLDYRDHFSECHEMPGSYLAKVVEIVVDRALARRADKIVTVSEPMARYYRRWNPSVSTVMNGFDPAILDQIRTQVHWRPRELGVALRIRYLGMITPDRVPRNLLTALMRLREHSAIKDSAIQFEFYGESSVLQSVLKKEFSPLLPLFGFKPSVPYLQALELMVTSDYLLFSETSQKNTLSAQGILTTKLFEYLASGRPVIADIDPSTLAGQVISKCGPNHFVSDAVDSFVTYLSAPGFFDPVETSDHPNVKALSRKEQAAYYLQLLDKMCSAGSV